MAVICSASLNTNLASGASKSSAPRRWRAFSSTRYKSTSGCNFSTGTPRLARASGRPSNRAANAWSYVSLACERITAG